MFKNKFGLDLGYAFVVMKSILQCHQGENTLDIL